MSRDPVRPARPEDLPHLPGIETAAAALFPEQDLPATLRSDTTSPETFASALADGRLWVACVASGDVVGFALVRIVDGNAHLVEMDVHPDHARRGLGTRLLARVVASARREGRPAVTLTTFAHLPWNAPFYERAGFRVLEPAQIGPELAAILRDEAERGLRRRVAMALPLATPRV